MKHRRGRDRDGILRGRGRIRQKQKCHSGGWDCGSAYKNNVGMAKPYSQTSLKKYKWYGRVGRVHTICKMQFALIELWLYKKYGNCDFFIQ
jgi:hypothetical protein